MRSMAYMLDDTHVFVMDRGYVQQVPKRSSILAVIEQLRRKHADASCQSRDPQIKHSDQCVRRTLTVKSPPAATTSRMRATVSRSVSAPCKNLQFLPITSSREYPVICVTQTVLTRLDRSGGHTGTHFEKPIADVRHRAVR